MNVACSYVHVHAPHLLSAGTPDYVYHPGPHSVAEQAAPLGGTDNQNTRLLAVEALSSSSRDIVVEHGRGIGGVADVSRGNCRIVCQEFPLVGGKIAGLLVVERNAALWLTVDSLFGSDSMAVERRKELSIRRMFCLETANMLRIEVVVVSRIVIHLQMEEVGSHKDRTRWASDLERLEYKGW